MSKRISVTAAAEIMGIAPQSLRIGLQRGRFQEIGDAFQGKGNYYVYVIYPEALKTKFGEDRVNEVMKKYESTHT